MKSRAQEISGSSTVRERRGVALLLVLGMLSLILMLAVAFGLNMRIERITTAHYSINVKSRHYVHVGIARAMEFIEEDVGSGLMANWSAVANTTGGDPVNGLMVGEVTNFVPKALLAAAYTAAGEATWSGVAGDPSKGVYTYAIMNLADSLDVGSTNAAGGEPRAHGVSSREIVLSEFPAFAGGGSVTSFLEERGRRSTYESFAEMTSINMTSGAFSQHPQSLNAWSLFRPDFTNRADVSGSPGSWGPARFQAITNGFWETFGSASLSKQINYSRLAMSNLLDYIDADHIPQDLASGSTEAVPMINEIIPTFLVSIAPDSSIVAAGSGLFIQAELAYPFYQKTDSAYDLQISWTSTGQASNSHPGFLLGSGTTVYPDVYGFGQDVELLLTPNLKIPLDLSSGNMLGTNLHTIAINVKLKFEVLQGGTTNIVDAAPWPRSGPAFSYDFEFSNVTTNSGTVSRYMTNTWSECLDPRFNWNVNSPLHWLKESRVKMLILRNKSAAEKAAATHTAGFLNTYTKCMWNPTAYGFPENSGPFKEEHRDEDMRMHVADEPLKTVGEIGYLAYAPWHTVRLFKHSASVFTGHTDPPAVHDVYRYFEMGDTAEENRRGLIPLNTQDTNIMQAAFVDMPYNVGAPEPWQRVDSATASAVGNAIMMNGPYANFSEMATHSTGLGGIFEDYGNNNLEQEAFLRNAEMLFGSRQNLFLIVAGGRFYTDTMGAGGVDIAYRRALVIVWRDPEETFEPGHPTDPHHDSFVRYFQWLDN